uniref:dnaJ homolog subfamily B member 13-like n=1 Tax=Myxine glutinosa TaxID=7769 RepID=UPI00358EFB08
MEDPYIVLELTRNASEEDVQRAFRVLALKFHPQQCSEVGPINKFLQVARAYDILSNRRWRSVYDHFGKAGLKVGFPAEDGTWSPGYHFHGDAMRVFHEFFGGDNPYDVYFHEAAALMGSLPVGEICKSLPAISYDLSLSLEELYFGATKKMKLLRRVLNADGQSSTVQESILSVPIGAGWRDGTQLIYNKMGDECPDMVPADVVFVVREKPHEIFSRNGNNLHCTMTLSLLQALVGCSLKIETLDGRKLGIAINDIVRPSYMKIILGEGMPIPGQAGEKGDLHITFNLQFPTTLSTSQKQALREVLASKHFVPAYTLTRTVFLNV